jgi:hypothetical protein
VDSEEDDKEEEELATPVVEQLATPVAEQLATPVAGQLATPVTEQLATPVAEQLEHAAANNKQLGGPQIEADRVGNGGIQPPLCNGYGSIYSNVGTANGGCSSPHPMANGHYGGATSHCNGSLAVSSGQDNYSSIYAAQRLASPHCASNGGAVYDNRSGTDTRNGHHFGNGIAGIGHTGYVVEAKNGYYGNGETRNGYCGNGEARNGYCGNSEVRNGYCGNGEAINVYCGNGEFKNGYCGNGEARNGRSSSTSTTDDELTPTGDAGLMPGIQVSLQLFWKKNFALVTFL